MLAYMQACRSGSHDFSSLLDIVPVMFFIRFKIILIGLVDVNCFKNEMQYFTK